MAPSTVVVTIEKPNNLSVVQINAATAGDDSPLLPADKQKAASPKQFTFSILLKIYRAFSCISWLAVGSNSLFKFIKKRVSQSEASADEVEEQDMEPRSRGKLYNFIKAFLAISIGALVVEVVAHYNKWNLNLVQPWEVQGLVQWSYMAWLSFRLDYIAPTVMMLSQFCIVLFLIQSLDRLVLCLGCFWIKFKKLKPQINGDDYDVE
ncbi:unnamed protein product [Linum trigynum]|uniref:Uncharacterized protein n=1 Tax=Linum trigynum TaxID=586398 RepID=A0AAV2CYZ7_9ROSI